MKWSAVRTVAAAAILAALSACATVPDVNKVIAANAAPGAPQTIVGASGPLGPAQSKAILVKLETQTGGSDLLAQHLAIEQAVAGTPLVIGNKTRILQDGTETFRAMFAAIRSARRHVNLEYYIFEDIESDHQKLSDLLLEKRRQGVAVNVIYDSYGSMGTPSALFKRLRDAGVALVEYNPMNPVNAAISGYSPNDRDHRKILLVDGRIGIVGGVNLSSAYEKHPYGKLVGSDGQPAQYWRDLDLEIEGPVVVQLEALFIQHWTQQKGPKIDESGFLVAAPPADKQLMRIIGSSSADTIPRYYATLLSAITNAEKRIWVTTAYFVPTDEEEEDLEAAAKRGVDVRLLLPSTSDSGPALAMQHAAYGELLEAGVRIYETQGEVLHTKTAVIDGVWSVVGSSNFDHRSALFNDEVDAVVLGRETAAALEAIFATQQRRANEIDLAAWRDRPFSQKVDETFSALMRQLL